jgi:hypothetical protein
MSDLKSKRWIIVKGIAFLGIAVVASALILFESPSGRTAALLAVLVWAVCRFYYFLFYVLERYVDPSLRYASIIALIRAILAKRCK